MSDETLDHVINCGEETKSLILREKVKYRSYKEDVLVQPESNGGVTCVHQRGN